MSGTKNMSWSVFKTKRRRVLRFLESEYNKAKHEAIFDEDFERLQELEKSIKFIKSMDFDKFLKSTACPICGETKWTYGCADAVMFYGMDDKELGKLERLTIYKGEGCGCYCVEGW